MSFHLTYEPINTALSPLPRGFITAFDKKLGVEIFEKENSILLRLLTQMLNVWILPVLSSRCFHQWGGAKMMLRELTAWMQPGDFVYKTDVYSYYASINHSILFHQLKSIQWPIRFFEILIAYCERSIFRVRSSFPSKIGIPKGGSLSPVLGTLYLTPLDQAMKKWSNRIDCFYARFQDDIILASRKRHLLKRMKKQMHCILTQLRLSLRPEKTFVGRNLKGFDLLGYHIAPDQVSASQRTIDKAFENAKRRYAQGGNLSLAKYLKRWKTWIHAGLPFKIINVDDTIQKIRDQVVQERRSDQNYEIWGNGGMKVL